MLDLLFLFPYFPYFPLGGSHGVGLALQGLVTQVVFFPQHFVFGSPFLLSLSAYTCNGGTHDFYPPLSTRPFVVVVIVPPQPVTLCISMDRVGMLKQEYT